MSDLPLAAEQRRIAEMVRNACMSAALNAYERASTDGLCPEGAFECAIDAIRSMEITTVLQQLSPTTGSPRSHHEP
ncbi:MAG: acetyltransferase [Chloroflexi bacterium]|nr:acetyltransferase [Chloroflexota bacterium]